MADGRCGTPRDIFWHCSLPPGWLVAGVPLPGQPGARGHGPTLAEFAPAFAEGADHAVSILSQMVNPGLPLVVPAASMDAAQAAQPDHSAAFVDEVAGKLARVEGWVPHALEDLVVWVCQCFPSLVIEANTCDSERSRFQEWETQRDIIDGWLQKSYHGSYFLDYRSYIKYCPLIN
jgi:hypothetical protein